MQPPPYQERLLDKYVGKHKKGNNTAVRMVGEQDVILVLNLYHYKTALAAKFIIKKEISYLKFFFLPF